MNGKHIASFALAAQVALIGACASAQSNEQQTPAEAGKPGPLAGAPTARITSRIETDKLKQSDEDLVIITHLKANEAYRREFRVLFGSLCNRDGMLCDGSDDCGCTLGEGVFHNDDPEWEIKGGYAMIRGYRPRVRTSRSTAAAEGTDFFVQIDKTGGKEVHRFALLKGGPLHLYKYVNNNSDHPDKLKELHAETTLENAQTYAEVTVDDAGNVNFSNPLSFPPTDDGSPGANLRKLIVAVEAKPLAKATE